MDDAAFVRRPIFESVNLRDQRLASADCFRESFAFISERR